ncbi:hypothetical protein TNCV_2568161 [Trichonephila clavipes]|uniref:Uncharacterized protein n=1 Tax=Trichonephila clavipes TaxID=2585209 RepID=A0A8X6WM96_TRICX|nr:hypothetical protein TNCV_2568161 [Trichonephila clavipes]
MEGTQPRGLKKHLINNTGLALGTVNEAAGFSLRRYHRNDVIIQLPRIKESPIGPIPWGPQHVTLRFILATPTRQRWHLPPKWPKRDRPRLLLSSDELVYYDEITHNNCARGWSLVMLKPHILADVRGNRAQQSR